MELSEACSERTGILLQGLIDFIFRYENTAPLRRGGKECWVGERRWRVIWAQCPQTSQTLSSPVPRPPGLLRRGDLCAVQTTACPPTTSGSHQARPAAGHLEKGRFWS